MATDGQDTEALMAKNCLDITETLVTKSVKFSIELKFGKFCVIYHGWKSFENNEEKILK